MDDQLIGEFLYETENLIEELHGDISMLRARRSDGRQRRELVGRIFRRVHTLKSTSAAAELAGTSRLAHELEALLDAVLLGRVMVNDAVLDAFEDALAAFDAGLCAVAPGEHESAPRALVERLRSFASGGFDSAPTGEAEVEEFANANLAYALGAHERQRLREALTEGARAYVLAADFPIASFDEELRHLSDALQESGEVIATQPSVDVAAPDLVSFRLLYASAEARDPLRERIAQLGARLCVDEDSSVVDDDAAEASGVGAEAKSVRDALRQTLSSATHARVPLETLNDLVSAARELSGDVASALKLGGDATRAEREELETRAERIRQRFFELEEALTGLRTVDARPLLERAASAGRSAARASGKQIEIEVVCDDVRLDAPLSGALFGALLHLVRNALAHGIETPEDRRGAGKPERGRVRLEALNEDGFVVLRVSDDGRGVDSRVVAEAAYERGLIAPGESLSEAQALRLIFRPGFSTAARASSLSGRGVGLDVVEQAAREAGGEVRVSSDVGRGATFELHLPSSPLRHARD